MKSRNSTVLATLFNGKPPMNLNLSSTFALISLSLFVTTAAVAAQPTRPQTVPDANLPFTGVYRASAKTSIARSDGSMASTAEYPDLPSLLATLPKDTSLRAKYPALKPHKKDAPAQRVPEEQRNVRIKDCWILVVKYEKSKVRNGKRTGDNDFHLVIGSAPSKTAGQRMNMEVAGLPKNGGPDAAKLLAVRKTFLLMCLHPPPAGRFAPFDPPIHVSIEGSLFFDGEHTADQIAPAYHLTTTWEVHPITKISRL